MSVLDVSNYDASSFNGPALKAAGVERLIVGCQNFDAALRMVSEGRDAGILIEDLYTFLYFGLAGGYQDVDRAIALGNRVGGIKRIWLDVEADPPNEATGLTPELRLNALLNEVSIVEDAGFEAGIYTYRPYWVTKMGDTREFAGKKLWFANYGLNLASEPRGPVTEVAFGGWTQVAIHQYSSTIPVAGRERDHNYWFINEEKDEMAGPAQDKFDALREEFKGLNAAVVKRFDLINIASATDEAGYAKMLAAHEALKEKGLLA